MGRIALNVPVQIELLDVDIRLPQMVPCILKSLSAIVQEAVDSLVVPGLKRLLVDRFHKFILPSYYNDYPGVRKEVLQASRYVSMIPKIGQHVSEQPLVADQPAVGGNVHDSFGFLFDWIQVQKCRVCVSNAVEKVGEAGVSVSNAGQKREAPGLQERCPGLRHAKMKIDSTHNTGVITTCDTHSKSTRPGTPGPGR
jgi:hypothetical protein